MRLSEELKISAVMSRENGQGARAGELEYFAEKVMVLEKKAKLWDELDLLGKHDCS